VIEAIDRAGGGRIGAYTHCTFRVPGTGTFFGSAGAHPAVGQAGRLEEVEEYRLETVVPASAREAVVREVRAVHPYEEPAFEFHLLAPERRGAGLGLLAPPPCELVTDPPRKACTARELAAHVKARLGACLAARFDESRGPRFGERPGAASGSPPVSVAVRLSGPPDKKIRRVAVCSVRGGSYLGKVAGRADAYLTGEINYHQAVEAHARGIAVIEVGHFESEVLVAAPLAVRLAAAERLIAAGVEVFAARHELQPFLMM
ncbi:MAG: Nif3-like dinuclear metal center hexameric protein, partial [bacterium]|nr:Nif3-like dinuclear metal center hexameric protein [bacterium]